MAGPGSKPGERRGGRKPGVPNKATADIKAAAQGYGTAALERLVELMDSGNEETALKAVNSVLDRAYGKPAQTLQGDAEKPLEMNVTHIDAFTARIAEMAEKVNSDDA